MNILIATLLILLGLFVGFAVFAIMFAKNFRVGR
nr:MAG TPA: hypothetical protein [Caudoviricetes sp.]DAY12527.1 MAG TPA: hypothetical protein [Caudoviricetes sp.]